MAQVRRAADADREMNLASQVKAKDTYVPARSPSTVDLKAFTNMQHSTGRHPDTHPRACHRIIRPSHARAHDISRHQLNNLVQT